MSQRAQVHRSEAAVMDRPPHDEVGVPASEIVECDCGAMYRCGEAEAHAALVDDCDAVLEEVEG